MRQINYISITSEKIEKPLNLGVVADLHNGPFEELLPALKGCDAILIVGDLVERHHDEYQNAIRFLEAAPEVAPTFYAIGNHERKLKSLADYWPHVERSRVTVLDNCFQRFEGIVLGGLSSSKGKPDTSWLPDMAAQEGFKLLMCHHPEYFRRRVRRHEIDLTISGHAHGGQVRIGRQGLYAPGQGLLPRLTSGFYYRNRLLVSRGLTNATWAPRINCDCELIILNLSPKEASHA